MNYIYGLSKSGISIAKYLKKNKKDFDIWDDNILIRNKIKKKFIKSKINYPSKKKLLQYSNIFVSPGINLYDKKFQFLKNSNKLKRDLNLYYEKLSNEIVIAITGTNGKSTTTKLIGNILKKNNYFTFVGGNIGTPLCNSLLSNKKYTHHVIELSSFQLEQISKFDPKISILLNISNDHMDRYNNINHYIKQKKKIITHNISGYNLISIDDQYTKQIYNSLKIKNKISFSISNPKADIYFKKNYIYDNYFNKKNKINIKNISLHLSGTFNLQNILAAYICSKILKISNKIFSESISKFKGLPYRFTVIKNNKKHIIINNSKSTNLQSTIQSIVDQKNVYLILGGIAKEKNFKKLSMFKDNINKIYVYGESAINIHKNLNKFFKIKKFLNLKEVISQIFIDIKLDNMKVTILFAPACSSYDQYVDFESRGDHFNKLIKKKLKN